LKKKSYNVIEKNTMLKIMIKCTTHQRKNIQNKQNNISNLLGSYRSPFLFPTYNTNSKKELTKLITVVSCRSSIDKNM
jgi:hypothetical protein